MLLSFQCSNISSWNLPRPRPTAFRHLPEQLDGILVDRQVELKYTGNVRAQNLMFERSKQEMRIFDSYS